jgi:hypothetical protein
MAALSDILAGVNRITAAIFGEDDDDEEEEADG